MIDNTIEGDAFYIKDTPLITAIKDRRILDAKKLLKIGEDVHKRGKWLTTPLIEAARANKADILEILVNKYKVRIDAVDCFNKTAIMYAAWGNRIDAARFLVKAAPELIDNVTDFNVTALHYATTSSAAEVVRILVDAGACTEIRTNALEGEFSHKHYTALEYAVEWGKIDVIKALIKGGAKKDCSLTERNYISPDNTEMTNKIYWALKEG